MSEFSTLKNALEAEVKSLGAAITAIQKDGIQIDGDNVRVDEKAYALVTEHKNNVKRLQDVVAASATADEVKGWLAEPVDSPAAYGTPTQFKSVADALFESGEFKDMMDNGRFNMTNDVVLEIADVTGYGVKDVYSALGQHNVPTNIGTVRQDLPMLGRPQQRQRVRDLFPAARTSANLIEYFVSMGLVENGGKGAAAPVPERTADNTNFFLKPKSTLNFTSRQDPVRTIAHWTAAHRNTLSDKPALRNIIDNELLYGLALVEDDQLLNGDGSNENLVGLLNRPGIQSYTAPDGELKADSLRRAQTLAALALFPANGYVLHPNDWEDIELQKGSTNDHYMIVSNISVGASTRVWRLPVVETPVIAEGTFLTAAFGQATQIYDRERANIRVAEQHADFFVRNAVAILCEERLALTVSYPQAVVKGTFDV